ncbi:4Fe-4S dicluster domain-containing protein [Acetobacterium fimetarium]|uniref:4Fe-4S dicluster domain-containing protein n=1 Tax=Acetobacterium fimetarium TaxID=52691 RepID=A0ABR6WRF0_9FIRM|nr:EFR1 family ferrodoxin [Acetobacterium fimetarium]MBC3802933.1 4Fe-4S dicluster domain-containing protein [Acetobacterium fimetarium]
MITIYFSGTGNSQYIAERFSQIMDATCYSIEEAVDFNEIITAAQTIVVCYPIYGSCVPKIMRAFVRNNQAAFAGKKLIIFCTQLLFSGDGARVFTELLTGVPVDIRYAEHFNMPNNICNFFLFPLANASKRQRYLKKADQKLRRAGQNITAGVVKKRGFNPVSRYLGLWTQRAHFGALEKKAERDVRISAACNGCGKCVRICPMKNLKITDQSIAQLNRCTLCYRCVNQCPQKAITVLVHTPVSKQYQGIVSLSNDN